MRQDLCVEIWSIVLAGGSGSRFGRQLPKQYETLRGRRVLDWSLGAARAASDGVVLVVAAEFADRAEPSADVVVVGGSERSDSVRAGLDAVPRSAEVIVVHDAARPLAGSVLFETVLGAVEAGADGAIPGIAVTDTIKRVVDDKVVETIDRRELVAVQTPQAFKAESLRRAHSTMANATDDAMLVEAVGGTVVVVPGDPSNIKITHPPDMAVAAAFMR